MTTIAYRNGIMAGDTAGNDGETRAMECEKVRRLKGGWVVGFAGTMCLLDHIMEAVGGGLGRAAPSPHLMDLSELLATEHQGDERELDDVGLLMAHKTHGVFRAELTQRGQLMCWRLGEGYHALGSGNAVALGAMHHGASAREAVEAAMDHDTATGGHVTEVAV